MEKKMYKAVSPAKKLKMLHNLTASKIFKCFFYC